MRRPRRLKPDPFRRTLLEYSGQIDTSNQIIHFELSPSLDKEEYILHIYIYILYMYKYDLMYILETKWIINVNVKTIKHYINNQTA